MVRVYLRGPSTGTSTGGNTGGGTGGSSSGGGYDRYVGTLGRAADAPAGAIFPHNTEFPAANKYDWLQVVSNATINGKPIAIDQELVCTENNTPKGTASKWELRQNIKQPALILLNSFTRYSSAQSKNIIQPGRPTPIAFGVSFYHEGGIIYADNYRTEITSWLKYYDEGASYVIFDIAAQLYFSANPEGFRECRVYVHEFSVDHTPGAMNGTTLLVGEAMNGELEGTGGSLFASATNNASARGSTSVIVSLDKLYIDLYADFQTIFYLYANHNAPVNLEVGVARLSVSMWGAPNG